MPCKGTWRVTKIEEDVSFRRNGLCMNRTPKNHEPFLWNEISGKWMCNP
jgi:hypothetical protein